MKRGVDDAPWTKSATWAGSEAILMDSAKTPLETRRGRLA